MRLIFLIVFWTPLAFSSGPVIKVKKGVAYSPSMKLVRTDKDYNYFLVSQSDFDLMKAADQVFAESKNQPPPSASFQNKMQDQVGLSKSRRK